MPSRCVYCVVWVYCVVCRLVLLCVCVYGCVFIVLCVLLYRNQPHFQPSTCITPPPPPHPQERSKPIQPPKKPAAAPFFLPTLPGLSRTPVFDVDGEEGDHGDEMKGELSGSRVLSGMCLVCMRVPHMCVDEYNVLLICATCC